MCYGYDGEGALQRSMEKRGMSRRSLLRNTVATAAGAAAFATTGVGAAASAHPGRGNAKGRPVPPGKISIQLYTLRAIMRGEGVDTTLAHLAETGYPRVELAGYYGRTAAEMRATLDGLGIRASSSHDGISSSAQALEAKLDNAETMGQKFMVVPFLASSDRAAWQGWAERMNVEAAAAKQRGIRYGYHNHAHEFTTDLGGGVTPWDVLTDELDPRLVHLEVDLYWAVTGGKGLGLSDDDSIDFAIDVIQDAPQQVRQYHVKDRNPANGDHADLGTGYIDFARIFDAHRVEEYIVENDTPDVTPIQTADVGYAYLRNLRF
ncbi:sugar phosphate isomerase/epimerase family protein [Nocardioides donggukensis]|uniref:Sugar phosphate isomerase/epimerase n=1 Tax=Nocardioides donggukensis TaxID=2774019 RepID=A0A927K6A7_9ACTN|nr:sugar phosphate isomerase/epimerase [Nocardioides donggukensis]MBD8870633.1 sugar phosphate isomerase/epimerase [Nocardioides donggukensis]